MTKRGHKCTPIPSQKHGASVMNDQEGGNGFYRRKNKKDETPLSRDIASTKHPSDALLYTVSCLLEIWEQTLAFMGQGIDQSCSSKALIKNASPRPSLIMHHQGLHQSCIAKAFINHAAPRLSSIMHHQGLH
eukprot:762402-Pelagomonas_calceolata.AAC.2